MAYAPNTFSIIDNNGNNRTGVGLYTMIVLRVGPNPIGAVQELSITEDRSIQTIDEVGTDGHIDSAPNSSTKITGTCKRIRYDRQRITEAFSRGFLHVKSQRVPLTLDIYDKYDGDNGNVIITTVSNIWINNIQYSYSASDFILADSMSFTAEDISSTLNGGNAASGGARAIILQTDTQGIEAQTDRGLRRGSLDAPGLINAVFQGF